MRKKQYLDSNAVRSSGTWKYLSWKTRLPPLKVVLQEKTRCEEIVFCDRGCTIARFFKCLKSSTSCLREGNVFTWFTFCILKEKLCWVPLFDRQPGRKALYMLNPKVNITTNRNVNGNFRILFFVILARFIFNWDKIKESIRKMQQLGHTFFRPVYPRKHLSANAHQVKFKKCINIGHFFAIRNVY
jgi:hypothetical protein